MYKGASEKSRTLIKAILSKRVDIDKCKSRFMTHILLLFLQLPTRHHFKGMERYGTYSESTYRTNFEKYGTCYSNSPELIDLNSRDLWV